MGNFVEQATTICPNGMSLGHRALLTSAIPRQEICHSCPEHRVTKYGQIREEDPQSIALTDTLALLEQARTNLHAASKEMTPTRDETLGLIVQICQSDLPNVGECG